MHNKAIGATKPKGVTKIGRNLIQPMDVNNPSQVAVQRYKALQEQKRYRDRLQAENTPGPGAYNLERALGINRSFNLKYV